MRIHVYWVLLAGLLLSCDKHATESLPPGPDPIQYIEFDPSLAPDRRTVFFVGSNSETGERSLFSMSKATAQRTLLFTGNIHRSPTASMDNSRVAFIDKQGLVRIYDIGGKTISEPLSDQMFASVLYTGNGNLVACQDNLLYRINDGEVTVIGGGNDPTFYAPDTFLYVATSGSTSRIMRADDYELTDNVLATISGYGRIYFPSIDRSTGRLCYSILSSGSFSVQAFELDEGSHTIHTSPLSRSLITTPDQIIMTGSGGTLHASDFAGTLYYPFIPAVGP